MWRLRALVAAAWLCALARALPCPPQGFNSKGDLDNTFFSGTWHVQLQVRASERAAGRRVVER
jgi:hypothetical protein